VNAAAQATLHQGYSFKAHDSLEKSRTSNEAV
jgi:hypothetical protein